MPVYIPPNRNLVPATPDITGSYTKTEADSRFVHNFGNELINGVKIFSNTPTLNNSAKILSVTPQKVLTTDVSGIIISSPYGINDLSLKSSTDDVSGKIDGEIVNRIAGDNYLQQQINQVASAQYLVFSEQFSGNGVSKQFQLNGAITNAQFVSGGWNVINVQNSLPSDVTDINGKPIYDAGILSLFTRHRIGVNSITGNAYVNLDYIPQNNQVFKVWYWYSLSDFDRIDNYYRDDFVARMETEYGELATGTAVNTVNFNGILSAADDTVQKALDTIDDVAISKSEVSNISGYLLNQISTQNVTGYATLANVSSASANSYQQSKSYTNIISGNLSNNISGLSQSISAYVPYIGATTNVDLGTRKLTVDAVKFNTNPITPVAPGQISWNDVEKTFNMGLTSEVTLQAGQEDVIRVHNNTASNITNGQPLYIMGYIANDDTPLVALAGATLSGNGSMVCGVATELISAGQHGFATVRGKVHDLNTLGYTPGQRIFLGETPGTFTSNTSGFSLSSHLNGVGYVGIVDAISGSIYVSIRNESSILSLSDRETSVLLGNTISTGVYEYTGMTKTTSSTFTVPPLKGWIVENTGVYATQPLVTSVNYSGGTYPVTNILTDIATYVMINKTGVISQQVTYPTSQQRRDNIFLGKVVHTNKLSILTINNAADYEMSPFSALRDMFSPISLINDGVTIYPDGSNLSFNKSAGSLYGMGINWINDNKNPNKVSMSAATPTTFGYYTQTSVVSSGLTLIDPDYYDVGGVRTAISTIGDGNKQRSTNQRVYQFSTGNVIIQYGQQVYDSLSLAVVGSQSETFVEFPAIPKGAVLIGVISVRRTATVLNDTAWAVFTPVSIFGESIGGTSGISTTTLQNAYDNSAQPEIITNSVLDGITFRRGSASDADDVLQIQNGSGVNVITLNGLGNITTTSLSGNSNNFVSHDISGRLIDSGFNTTIANSLSANALTQANAFTYSASSNLQQQISQIVQEGTTITSSAGSISVSKNGLIYNVEVSNSYSSNYTSLLTTSTISGQLYSLVNSTSASIVNYDIAQDNAMSGALVALTYSASANAFNQANAVINSITGDYVDLVTNQSINGNKRFNNYVIASVISAGNSRLTVSRDGALDPGAFPAVTQPTIILMSNNNASTGLVFQNKNGGSVSESRFAVVENGDGNGSSIAVSMPGSGNASTMFGIPRPELATIFVNSAGTPRKLGIGTYTNQDVILAANNTELIRLDASQQDFIIKGTIPVSASPNTVVAGGGSLIAKNNISGNNIIVSSLGTVNGNFLSSDVNNRIIDSGFNTTTLNSITGSLQTQITSLIGVTGNFVTFNNSETINGQKTFTSPITLTNGTTAQFFTSTVTQSASFVNTIIDQFYISAFNGCNWDVVIKDSSNLRICNVMAGWVGGSITYTETNAPDIGDTSSVALNVALISGGTYVSLQATAIGSSNWTIKALRKCL